MNNVISIDRNFAENVGTALPALSASTITQGGPPNFADTYVTPFSFTEKGSIFSWEVQMDCGCMLNGGCAIPVGMQLKVLRRQLDGRRLQVIAAGEVHNPLAELKKRFPGSDCPQFKEDSDEAVLKFSESGLAFSPDDIVGLTIMSDPRSAGYFYPLMPADSDTRLVMRNAAVGDVIDLADIYTGTLHGLTPAVLLSVGCVEEHGNPRKKKAVKISPAKGLSKGA